MHNGPRGRMEGQAKNFPNAMKRLFAELSPFKILIGIALILAALGSVLSILAPDQLSKLTDEVSKGLVINTNNLSEFSNKIS